MTIMITDPKIIQTIAYALDMQIEMDIDEYFERNDEERAQLMFAIQTLSTFDHELARRHYETIINALSERS